MHGAGAVGALKGRGHHEDQNSPKSRQSERQARGGLGSWQRLAAAVGRPLAPLPGWSAEAVAVTAGTAGRT